MAIFQNNSPGITKVWLRGIRLLSQFPLDPHKVDELVSRMSWVQKPCTVWENALRRGSETLFKKDGLALKLARVRASNSSPSPLKSESRKSTTSPYVVPEEIFWKSARTACALLLVGWSRVRWYGRAWTQLAYLVYNCFGVCVHIRNVDRLK